MKNSIALVAFLCAALQPCPQDGTAYVELDYSKVDRAIAKEPKYIAAPRYALFVFGPRGESRMWAVLDKSTVESPYYDVLYFDRDADGDLTEVGERFQGTYDEKLAGAGVAMSIWIDELSEPGTGLVHKKFRVSTVGKQKDSPGIWFQMKWNGTEEISGGYAQASRHSTNWSSSPAEAPILRPTPRGTFSFGLYTWGGDEVVLERKGESKVYVMVGNAGSGPDTLAVVDEQFLDLEKDVLTVTLIGEDEEGNEVRGEPVRLKQHC
jgi:hypothetical protein